MAAKFELPNLDHWRARYEAGESAQKLASEIGVTTQTFQRKLRTVGVIIRGADAPRRLRIDIPGIDALISRYVAGETEQSLAIEVGISRMAFRKRLQRAGITPRGISETMFTRWKHATTEMREAMLSKAHAAMRGATIPDEQRVNHAIGRERALSHTTPDESLLASGLARCGLSISPQKAVGVYNIDIAVNEPRIAVEIFGGQWHAFGRHAARFVPRTKYLLDNGWHVLIVWTDKSRYAVGSNTVEAVVAFVNELRGNPSLVRQYRVIRGDGQSAPVTKSYFNTRAVIERLGAGNSPSGRVNNLAG